jgi:hypothetical protein
LVIKRAIETTIDIKGLISRKSAKISILGQPGSEWIFTSKPLSYIVLQTPLHEKPGHTLIK